MAYATIAEVRAEGVPDTVASDARVQRALDLATADIDRYCGWFFESRSLVETLDGRGVQTLEPRFPPITINEITLNGTALDLDPSKLEIVGSPLFPGDFIAPRLTRLPDYENTAQWYYGRTVSPVWTRGHANVVIDADWGYLEHDGTPTGRTPLAINQACLMIALRYIPELADSASQATVLEGHRLLSEKTEDQSYTLAPRSADAEEAGAPYTGDPNIDRILAQYTRPGGMAAAGRGHTRRPFLVY